jgi:hypothetical protein
MYNLEKVFRWLMSVTAPYIKRKISILTPGKNKDEFSCTCNSINYNYGINIIHYELWSLYFLNRMNNFAYVPAINTNWQPKRGTLLAGSKTAG